MIEERRSSRARVVLAFAATILVALAPLAVIAVVGHDSARALDETARYGELAGTVGVLAVLTVAAAAVFLAVDSRRRPRPVRS